MSVLLLVGIVAIVLLWPDSVAVALSLGLFLDAVSVLLIVVTIRRIPAWHRARKAAQEYIDQHGGEMPPELQSWR